MAKQSAQKSFIKNFADKSILPFSAAIFAHVNEYRYNFAMNIIMHVTHGQIISTHA